MAISVFDLFKVGIGPSSSHTVGPIWAAHRFLLALDSRGLCDRAERVRVELYGSLALTGLGHATDKALMLGLAGETPDAVDPDLADAAVARIRRERRLSLAGRREIAFDPRHDLDFRAEEILPEHPNGMIFVAEDGTGAELHRETLFSIGGGFVQDLAEMRGETPILSGHNAAVPHEFASAEELLARCDAAGAPISQVMLENERVLHPEGEIRARLFRIWEMMEGAIERGCREDGILPGGLKVKRRARAIRESLVARPEASMRDPLTVMDWVNLYALAVNEENAAGGRVVTAPTNGAAGVIPAVLAYYVRFVPGATDDGVARFMLTAGAIGALYKMNASISAAEVGCQGEVGVACSMAAGALTEVLGGTPRQAENAAEIGMEHNLGLTCDPIGGLVQVPCIERNTMGAVKAINAARLALKGDGKHFVSLDQVIDTMRETGRDMAATYKETSRGGLALRIPVAVTEC
ncbi:L-serine ammonia-lyase [Minwuia thermotolerans]|uniref:L-serine dehydratase n=1 Tax=Minwuia thermotolerans TaxID=2056226 RepID=A0A2M9FVX6_9PROT|nr:L-serine ammonia-lyase [Minwuia thermotolerans]PJK27593.1 L-serine ammonia-lyase [Minwuia thermotolerans]